MAFPLNTIVASAVRTPVGRAIKGTLKDTRPDDMAATVVKVEVTVGQQVAAGQELAVLEAMKMNNFVHAPREGTVSAIHVAAGDVVAEGQPLLTLA